MNGGADCDKPWMGLESRVRVGAAFNNGRTAVEVPPRAVYAQLFSEFTGNLGVRFSRSIDYTGPPNYAVTLTGPSHTGHLILPPGTRYIILFVTGGAVGADGIVQTGFAHSGGRYGP